MLSFASIWNKKRKIFLISEAVTSASGSLCPARQKFRQEFFMKITCFYPRWEWFICWSGAVTSWSYIMCHKEQYQCSSRVERLGWPWKCLNTLTYPSGRHQFLNHLFCPNLSTPVFIKLIYCCLWASLESLTSVWILAMKLSSVFVSAEAADELLKLDPLHCCDHAAGATGWASPAYVWPPKHCVTYQKPSRML